MGNLAYLNRIFSAYVLRKNSQLESLLEHNKHKLETLQVNFGQFAPQEVIEQLTDAEGRYKPAMQSVTVLFADLQGFSEH